MSRAKYLGKAIAVHWKDAWFDRDTAYSLGQPLQPDGITISYGVCVHDDDEWLGVAMDYYPDGPRFRGLLGVYKEYITKVEILGGNDV